MVCICLTLGVSNQQAHAEYCDEYRQYLRGSYNIQLLSCSDDCHNFSYSYLSHYLNKRLFSSVQTTINLFDINSKPENCSIAVYTVKHSEDRLTD